MPESFELALYSLLVITGAGVLSIAIARLTHVHPAYYFLACGVAGSFALPFTFPSNSLVLQLGQLGALFIIFLSALEIQWDLRFTWSLRTILSGFVVQLLFAAPVCALFTLWLKTDLLSAITAGLLVSMHAPERKSSLVGQTFRNNSVSNDLALMGLISEIVALVGISLLIAYTQKTVITGDLLQVAVGAILIVLVLVSFVPQVLRFLLRRIDGESYALYYLMLLLLIVVTLVVQRSGLEALLGAYAAGFFLTRFVMAGSHVLERLRFTGHSIIVPAFYLQIGFSSDLISGINWTTVSGAAVIAAITVPLAFIFARLLKRNGNDSQAFRLLRKNPLILVLIYIAHARGLVTTGTLHTLVLFSILNEVIVVLLSRFAVQPENETVPLPEIPRLLLPVSNPESMLPLLTLASHLGNDAGAARIYPLNVVPDAPGAEERIRSVETQFNELIPLFEVRDQKIELMARISSDRIHAVSHAARELLTDRILLGLGVIPTLQRPQGYSFLEALTEAMPEKCVIAAHIQTDLALTNSVNIIVAHERLMLSSEVWLPIVLNLTRRLKATPIFYAEAPLLAAIQQKLSELSHRHQFQVRAGQIHAGLDLLTLDNNPNAMSIAILERSAFYPQEKIHARLPEMMLRAFGDRNFMLLYPSGKMPEKRQSSGREKWRKIKHFLGFK